MKKLIAALALLLSGCHPVPASQLTDAIAQVESSGGRDLGYRGWHQLGPAAWADADQWRLTHKLATAAYEQRFDYQVSTDYCESYLSVLRERWQSLGRPGEMLPSQLLASYHCGFGTLVKHSFDPAFDQDYIVRVLNLVNDHPRSPAVRPAHTNLELSSIVLLSALFAVGLGWVANRYY